jgi:hypothetical protein
MQDLASNDRAETLQAAKLAAAVAGIEDRLAGSALATPGYLENQLFSINSSKEVLF